MCVCLALISSFCVSFLTFVKDLLLAAVQGLVKNKVKNNKLKVKANHLRLEGCGGQLAIIGIFSKRLNRVVIEKLKSIRPSQDNYLKLTVQ